HALAEAAAVVEDDLRPLEVRDERVDGPLDDQSDADRGREVVDDVDLVDELVDDRGVEDRVDDEVEVLPRRKVRDVVDRPRREIVERPDLPAVLEQQLREVRADEPGAAGDEGLRWHGESLPPPTG